MGNQPCKKNIVNLDLKTAVTLICEPIVSSNGKVISIEMLSRFSLVKDIKKQIPSEFFSLTLQGKLKEKF